VVRSAEVGPEPRGCAMASVTGAPAPPLRPAKYAADSRAERTFPRSPKPNRVTLPPPYGLMGSFVPFMISTEVDPRVGAQSWFSGAGRFAAMAATARTSPGASSASR
jgi:hypothetical protein